MLLWAIDEAILEEAHNRIHSHIDIVECAARNRATQVLCVDLVVVLLIATDELVDPRYGDRVLFELLESAFLRNLPCRSLCRFLLHRGGILFELENLESPLFSYLRRLGRESSHRCVCALP